MRSLVLVLCLLLSTTACSGLSSGPDKAQEGVVIHISSGPREPHRVCLALMMAVVMSEDRDVLVYFDVEGVQLAVRGARDITYGPYPGTRKSLGVLAERGVPLVACPGCLGVIERTEKQLLPGVTLGDRDCFFEFTEGRILTLDY